MRIVLKRIAIALVGFFLLPLESVGQTVGSGYSGSSFSSRPSYSIKTARTASFQRQKYATSPFAAKKISTAPFAAKKVSVAPFVTRTTVQRNAFMQQTRYARRTMDDKKNTVSAVREAQARQRA